MKEEYRDLFKRLVLAYKDGNFEEAVQKILDEDYNNRLELQNIIATLCGEDCTSENDFPSKLRKAIEKDLSEDPTEYKVVRKVKECSKDCRDKNGNIPCQSSCPFDAIGYDEDAQNAYIIPEKCTDCGFCIEGCKNGAIMDKVEFLPLFSVLKEKVPVIAIVAPAISGQFGEKATLNKLRAAFKKLGFSDMIEVAFFADMLTLKEAVEFSHHVKVKEDFLITSCCCPMWMGLIKRIYRELVPHVSPSVSPMVAGGRVLKRLNPACKVVFIGPCIAKKAEAKEKDLLGDIDFVLTFTELKDILEAFNINPELLEEDTTTEYASKGGRLYARAGGVSVAVSDVIKTLFPGKYEYLSTINASGVKQCKELLSKIQTKEISANFVEGMGCVGGCVGGPRAIIAKELGLAAADEAADISDIKIPTESECMERILDKININTKKDFMDKEKTMIFHRDL